jgi:transcriptional regulator with XRE-family HTH domain
VSEIEETATPTQRQLALRLRDVRKDAGLNQEQMAERCGWTQSKVSKIENTRSVPQVADVEAWARAAGLGGDERAALVDLAGRALTSILDWRSELRQGRAARQDEIRDLEARMSAIRTYQPLIVPGLLQTPEYTRRVFMLGRKVEHGDIDADVRARMRRQEILYQPDKTLRFVICEPALRWRVGPLPVVLGQLDRLASLMDLPNLEIGLIPWSTEATVLHYTGFQIFGEPGQDEMVVSVETLTRGLYTRDIDQVKQALDKFAQMQEACLYGAEAHALISSVAADLAGE